MKSLSQSTHRSPVLRIVSGFLLTSYLAGCAWFPVHKGVYEPAPAQPGIQRTDFVLNKDLKPGQFIRRQLNTGERASSTDQEAEKASAEADNSYHIGPGDIFDVDCRLHEDLSRQNITVSPDGQIELPRIGIMDVQGLSVRQLTEKITKAASVYYQKPEVSVLMTTYTNNKVVALGDVNNPGLIPLQASGRLLDVLAVAGGINAQKTQGLADYVHSTVARYCMITRGKSMVMNIDLHQLLTNGDIRLNVKMQPGDVVYVPINRNNAYVLGEVGVPGTVGLRPETTLWDALMYCGGPLKSANMKCIFVIHNQDGKGVVENVNLEDWIAKGDYRKNYVLQDGDMVYVPQTGLSRFNWYCGQLLPFFNLVGVATGSAANVAYLNGIARGQVTGSNFGGL